MLIYDTVARFKLFDLNCNEGMFSYLMSQTFDLSFIHAILVVCCKSTLENNLPDYTCFRDNNFMG